jgi:hypothetical protein
MIIGGGLGIIILCIEVVLPMITNAHKKETEINQ